MTPSVTVDSEAAMLALGGALAALTPAGVLIYLSGPLAAGKTTFARGFLRALGHAGTVKSPTFTVVESYPLPNRTVQHFDLYRLNDPEELYFLGFDDYHDGEAICLIEWPERGAGYLPPADLWIRLEMTGPEARVAHLEAYSPRARKVLDDLLDKANLSEN